jgi:thiol-disulfide isomerase/thioredoxin
MAERWQNLMMSRQNTLELSAELDDVLDKSRNEPLKTEAAYYKAAAALGSARGKSDDALTTIEAFIHRAPRDERGPALLFQLATNRNLAAEQKVKLLKRVVADYPDSRWAQMAAGSIKRAEGVGKPFDLEFTDAIKGTEISIKGLKGKVVVIDFWATWCGPCVAEMPTMKKLYAQYKDKGVEFIGVSLDQSKKDGGLDKLKSFVEKNEISWPQYYQGNYWTSEFSSSWGINSIPCVFVVDADGKLYSTEARGRLEEIIPELLKKAGDKTEAGAGGN